MMRNSIWKSQWLWLMVAFVVILPGVVLRDSGVSWSGLLLAPGLMSFFAVRHLQMLEEYESKRKEPLSDQKREVQLRLCFHCLLALVIVPSVFWLTVRDGARPDFWGSLFFVCYLLFDVVWAAWQWRRIRRAQKPPQSTLMRW